MKSSHYNHLIYEKSPYLLQHAQDPVDWYPWSEEAFERAHREGKLIFLSIGYSTCHWCHVMEQESFEDTEVARLMNETFINIKVDREERPDIDAVYMNVCQMLTGSGGWPLSIIMTPDKKPFFATTYIPKENRFGRMGMLELIPRIRDIWKNRREDMLRSAQEISTVLLQALNSSAPKPIDTGILEKAFLNLKSSYDSRYGGFGNAPKFPSPHNLFFLLRYGYRTRDISSYEMVEQTLVKMRLGGIYDQLGFGFHRYSTDEQWLVPHFEKMLYDQALLIMAYTEAFQATGNPLFKQTADEIIQYVFRELRSPEGGFYSAEDADSDGEEGKFYLWTLPEINEALSEPLKDFVAEVFNVAPGGNFPEENSGRKSGRNILHLTETPVQLSARLHMDWVVFMERLNTAREQLFRWRARRNHPFKDDKILTDWNGLMIAALSKAAQSLNNPDYISAAGKALSFILNNLTRRDGRLLHRYRQGEAKIEAFLDDYVFLIWGLLEYYEATFEVSALKQALKLNEILMKYFWDDAQGGFFTTPSYAEELLIRKKEIYDGAIPSGNSVQLLNILRLGRITVNPELEMVAQKLIQSFSFQIEKYPAGYTMFLNGVDFVQGPNYEVVIAGDPNRSDTQAMLQAIRSRFIPNKVVILRPEDGSAETISSLANFLKNMHPLNHKATAYVCRNYSCELPTTDITRMLSLLEIS